MSDLSPIYGQNPTTGVQEAIQTDGNKHLAIGLAAGSSLAINDAATPSQHLSINSSGAASFNLTQLLGSAPGLSNPFVMQDQLRAYALNGQMFSGTTGLLTSGGAIQTGFSLFNPVASGKTILVLSLHLATASSAQHHINSVTSNPNLTNAVTPLNNSLGSATASIASVSSQNTAVANTGSVLAATGTGGNTITEALQNGTLYVVPAGNGVLVLMSTSTNAWQVTAMWLEV